MNYFLAKTDPEVYSIENLEKEKTTVWNGIKNPQALQAIRSMRPGDLVFVYHSGGEATIMGLMKVVSLPREDEKNPKLSVVDVKFIKKYPIPIGLKEIKATHKFDDWNLVYQGRLSTMRVPEKFAEWVKKKYPGYL